MDALNVSSREQERLQRTFDALPDDVKTGLEIGFHDLRMTNILRKRIALVSIDLPKKVAEHDGYDLAFADIQALPFQDNAFDISICTEVLEHLPKAVLLQGVKELLRVSRKYILVSVPYQQRVWNEMFKCAYCGFIGNNMGHIHYMDNDKLMALFQGVTPKKTELIGTLPGYAPDWLYTLARTTGNMWYVLIYGNCPGCKRSPQVTPTNPWGYVVQRLIWRVERYARSRPAWLLMVFQITS